MSNGIIEQLVKRNKERCLQIAVIGDCIIDNYKYGHVTRVSPEFPIQVLTSSCDREELCPGGAANVCQQMTNFNVDVYLLGLIDKSARCLYESCKFDISCCVELRNGRVPHKTRFYDGDFPLLRWDIEQVDYGEKESDLEDFRQKILKNFINLANGIKLDAVILSDYDKGLWTDSLAQQVIRHCNRKGIMSVVDPKRNLDRWKHCTVFKPNADEAKKFYGSFDSWKHQLDYLQDYLNCKGVVVTHGGRGVVGKYRDNHFTYQSTMKLSDKEVNSVIGAGDFYAAMLAVCLSHDIDFVDACRIAFEGGVQYVKARHNRPITLQEIHSRFDNPASKVVDVDSLLCIKNNVLFHEEFVLTNGCFDLLHLGHLSTLQFAKSKGGKLVVAINSDESVKNLKGPNRPVRTYRERAAMVAALEYVDFVVEFEEMTPENLIKELKPDYLVKGGDYDIDDVVGKDLVKEVFIAPLLEGHSTTGFLQKLRDALNT